MTEVENLACQRAGPPRQERLRPPAQHDEKHVGKHDQVNRNPRSGQRQRRSAGHDPKRLRRKRGPRPNPGGIRQLQQRRHEYSRDVDHQDGKRGPQLDDLPLGRGQEQTCHEPQARKVALHQVGIRGPPLPSRSQPPPRLKDLKLALHAEPHDAADRQGQGVDDLGDGRLGADAASAVVAGEDLACDLGDLVHGPDDGGLAQPDDALGDEDGALGQEKARRVPPVVVQHAVFAPLRDDVARIGGGRELVHEVRRPVGLDHGDVLQPEPDPAQQASDDVGVRKGGELAEEVEGALVDVVGFADERCDAADSPGVVVQPGLAEVKGRAEEQARGDDEAVEDLRGDGDAGVDRHGGPLWAVDLFRRVRKAGPFDPPQAAGQGRHDGRDEHKDGGRHDDGVMATCQGSKRDREAKGPRVFQAEGVVHIAALGQGQLAERFESADRDVEALPQDSEDRRQCDGEILPGEVGVHVAFVKDEDALWTGDSLISLDSLNDLSVAAAFLHNELDAHDEENVKKADEDDVQGVEGPWLPGWSMERVRRVRETALNVFEARHGAAGMGALDVGARHK